MNQTSQRRWLVTGATGKLGGHVLRVLRELQPNDHVTAVVGSHSLEQKVDECRRVDLTQPAEIAAVVREAQPHIVLHLAAISDVNTAFRDPARAEAINVASTRTLVDAARDVGARVVFTSTVMVFDGNKPHVTEADATNPLSFYGKTKVAAEEIVAQHTDSVIVRLPLLFGFPVAFDEENPPTFVRQMQLLQDGAPLTLFADEYHSPLSLHDAALALVQLGLHDATGLFHLAGPARLSRLELIAQCAAALGVENPNLIAGLQADVEFPEPRPVDMSLDDGKLRALMPDLPRNEVTRAVLEPATVTRVAEVVPRGEASRTTTELGR